MHLSISCLLFNQLCFCCHILVCPLLTFKPPGKTNHSEWNHIYKSMTIKSYSPVLWERSLPFARQFEHGVSWLTEWAFLAHLRHFKWRPEGAAKCLGNTVFILPPLSAPLVADIVILSLQKAVFITKQWGRIQAGKNFLECATLLYKHSDSPQ